MHMMDPLISTQVGCAMWAVSGGLFVRSLKKIRENFPENNVLIMAALGAFVFAAHMLNFAIPATGSSGHIVGAVLLCAILGSHRAFVSISTILIVQALFFADGGLLALGCNIFNMGVIGCFVVYPLIFKPLVKDFSLPKIMIASVASCAISLLLGAFCVTLETLCSGITALPFGVFALSMLPIHLSIGLIEGVLTSIALAFAYNASPQLFNMNINVCKKNLSAKTTTICIGAAAFIMAGGLSLFASTKPDGLEWSIQNVLAGNQLVLADGLHSTFASVQGNLSYFAFLSTGLAGILGTMLTLTFVAALGMMLKNRTKNA